MQQTLPTRFLEAAASYAGRSPPPVERWNPAYCGEIDMRIAADGRWFYMGTSIDRPALVRLFASILRRDPSGHVLVTPVERVGIIVEDAPFLAVEMADVTGGAGPTLAFRTNLDEIVVAGPEHPLKFELDAKAGLKPYIRVRGELWARLTRSLAFELAERFETDDGGIFLALNGMKFRIGAELAEAMAGA